MSTEQPSSIDLGDHVVLGAVAKEPRLSGASGVVLGWQGALGVLSLDEPREGFPSQVAYFYADEVLSVLPVSKEGSS